MSFARLTGAYNSRVRKLAKTVLRSQLTNAVNASPQSIPIGGLPPNATVLQVAFKLNAQFTGGGATTVTATIGDTAGGVSRYGSGINLLGGTVGTVFIPPTTPGNFAGANPAADTVNLTVTPDAGHNLAALTTGSVDVEILYTVGDPYAN